MANDLVIASLVYLFTALFSPHLLCTLLLCAGECAAQISRAWWVWDLQFCLRPTTRALPYHAPLLVLAALVSYIQNQVMRRQHVMRMQLRRIKDVRIEQLGREKERLDFERAFALKQQSSSSSAGLQRSDLGPAHTGEVMTSSAHMRAPRVDASNSTNNNNNTTTTTTTSWGGENDDDAHAGGVQNSTDIG